MSLLILTIAIVIAVAALFACVEAAIFCTTFPRAQILLRQKRAGAKALVAIRERMSRPVTTLVIGTNVTTIVGSLFVGHVATEIYGNEAIGVVSAVVTFLIIVFGEIFPKVLGERFAEPIALAASRPLLVLTWIFSPVIWFIEAATQPFADHARKIVSEEELKILSEIGSREGTIEPHESELIRRAFTLNDMTAMGIMTPRKLVDALPGASAIKDVTAILFDRPYSRYPVYTGTIDTVIGIVQTKHLLTALSKEQGGEQVLQFMSNALFVLPTMRVDDLLAYFLARRMHMAIVQGLDGKTLGIVTLEDVLEQLVGEIADETDEQATAAA